MRRGLVWVLVVWMVVLTAWTGVLTFGGGHPAEAAAHDEGPRVLDVRDPVIVRYEMQGPTAGGEVLPPTTVPLWRYVEGGDGVTRQELRDFLAAFERDLHGGDSGFHLTHELIDGRRW